MNKYEKLVDQYVNSNNLEGKSAKEILNKFVSENKYGIRALCDFENYIEDVETEYEQNESHNFKLSEKDYEEITTVFLNYLDDNDSYWDCYWITMRQAIQTVLHDKLKDFIKERLKEFARFKEGYIGDEDDDEIEDIANDLRPDFENTQWSNNCTSEDYDGWYGSFMEENIMPVLKEIKNEQYYCTRL